MEHASSWSNGRAPISARWVMFVCALVRTACAVPQSCMLPQGDRTAVELDGCNTEHLGLELLQSAVKARRSEGKQESGITPLRDTLRAHLQEKPQTGTASLQGALVKKMLAAQANKTHGIDPTSSYTESYHTADTINRAYRTLFTAEILGIGLAILIDRLCCPRWFADKLMPFGLVALFGISYIALFPGVNETLFYCVIVVSDPRNVGKHENLLNSHETMTSVVSWLFDMGNAPAALAVAFYGLGVPALKFALLVTGSCLRGRPAKVTLYNRTINTIQFISKFDSPKLVCYGLIMCILKGQNYPGFINVAFQLDIGFVYYFIFCMFTLVGSLLLPREAQTQPALERPAPLAQRCLGLSQQGFFFFNACLACIFLVSMYCATFHPFLSVTWDFLEGKDVMKTGFFDPSTLKALDMKSWTQKDLSLASCISMCSSLFRASGAITTFMVWITLAVFVVAFTLVDALMLVTASFLVAWAAYRPEETGNQLQRARQLMDIAHWLKYLSMLDVAAFGIALQRITMVATFGRIGLQQALLAGYLWLILAEVLHYVLYYQTAAAVEQAAARDSKRSERQIAHL